MLPDFYEGMWSYINCKLDMGHVEVLIRFYRFLTQLQIIIEKIFSLYFTHTSHRLNDMCRYKINFRYKHHVFDISGLEKLWFVFDNYYTR